jgi:pimeloyl-ACP methyl ester carboxylesterase
MAPQSPDIDRWLTWHYYTQGSEAFKGDLYFYSVDHDLRDRLGEIDAERFPLVLLSGTYDYLTTPEMCRATSAKIKGSKYIEMKDIGHFPMSENYPVFRRYLREALDFIEQRAQDGARAGAPQPPAPECAPASAQTR